MDRRAKNVLTVVQAALRLPPREDAASYARDVEGRVLALASAHTMLADASWRGASLHGVVRAELAGFLSDAPPSREEGRAPRAVLDGPDLLLNPISVQPLAMTVHELATDATKHGALSVPGGEVRLSWSHDRAAGLLRMRWEERGGPPPAPPARRSFGSRVIEATIREQLGGRMERRWTADGLVYEAAITAARVLADDNAPAPP
ncbi:HWE histidine kinase domain-containing protein [Muricoccus aerilatus]|uniref:HWE histidine kinase domain-containing protein n=1 Tax=Muricoccus aerilatus TaxID=452982 RepID=UPI0006946AD5|nr:HWE histidine kinase domain-containing protein [Roseomonas aerilata]